MGPDTRHRIANNFSELDGYLHGELVGSLSLFCMYIQKNMMSEHLNFVTWIFSDWRKIFKTIDSVISPETFFKGCHSVRQDRKTVLNQFSEKELCFKFKDFLKYV